MREERRREPPAPREGGRRENDHPIASGVGAGIAGAAGAALGTVLGGPAGTIVGAAAAGIAGGVAGHKLAEAVNPHEEEAYWRENYRAEPYHVEGREWDHYAPAYRAGYEGRVRYDGQPYEDVERVLADDYRRYGGSDTGWEEVRPATRAAWDRVDRRIQNFTRN